MKSLSSTQFSGGKVAGWKESRILAEIDEADERQQMLDDLKYGYLTHGRRLA